MIGKKSRSMSSWVSGRISMRRMTPLRRIIGGWPTLRCRSEPSYFMTMRKSLLTSGSFLTSAAGLPLAVTTAFGSLVIIVAVFGGFGGMVRTSEL